MKQKTVLITAGPTKEYIDPVRFISNDSSGRMGYFLAEEAKRIGARVILISGPTNIKPPKGANPAFSKKSLRKGWIKVINVVSALEMFREVKKYFKKCDVFISCAAVGDYRVEKFSKTKIKKTNKPVNMKLIPNPDILYEVTRSPFTVHRSPFIVGFALETENLIKNAGKKLKEKKLDMIIANKINAMNSDKTTGAIIAKNKIKRFKNIPKKLLAKKIIGKII